MISAEKACFIVLIFSFCFNVGFVFGPQPKPKTVYVSSDDFWRQEAYRGAKKLEECHAFIDEISK